MSRSYWSCVMTDLLDNLTSDYTEIHQKKKRNLCYVFVFFCFFFIKSSSGFSPVLPDEVQKYIGVDNNNR